MDDSYKGSLEAAGATVLAYQEFGSYQGDWIAHVLIDGTPMFVQGSFGSCSGCDAFQAEFEFAYDRCDEHRYDCRDASVGCQACEEKAASTAQRLKDFGHGYLNAAMTVAEAIAFAEKRDEWDSDDESAMKAWVLARAEAPSTGHA